MVIEPSARAEKDSTIPARNIGVLSGDGQSMVMLPTDARAVAEHIDSLLLDVGFDGIAPANTGCDWYALPALMGTTDYVLVGDGQRGFDISDISGVDVEDLALEVCRDTDLAEYVAENLPLEMSNVEEYAVGDEEYF